MEKEYYQSINLQVKEIEVAVKQIVKEWETKHCSISSAILSEENNQEMSKMLDARKRQLT